MANPRIAPQQMGMAAAQALHPQAWKRALERQEAKSYWKHAPLIAIAMLGLVAVRFHEVMPMLRFVKPTFTVGVFGVGYLILRSSNKARTGALRYPPMKLVLAYFLWILFLVPFAIWPGRAFVEAQTLVPVVLMFITLVLCAPTREVADKVTWFYWLMVVGIGIAVYFYLPREDGRMSIGGTYDTNDSAALFATAIPFGLGIISRNRGMKRWLSLAGVLMLVAVIAGTQSRGGLIALGVSCFVFGWGFKASKRVTMMIAMVVLGLVGWTFTGPEFRERMATLLEIRNDYNFQTSEGRIAIWTRGVGYTAESPILGVGPGNFPYRDGQWLAQHGQTGKWSAAHNAYIQAFVDLGLPGGILYLSILIMAARRAYPSWRPRQARRKDGFHRPEYLAALVGFLIASIFLSNAYSQSLFGVLALVALLDRTRRSEERGQRAIQATMAAQAQQQAASLAGYGVPVPLSADARTHGLAPGGNGTHNG